MKIQYLIITFLLFCMAPACQKKPGNIPIDADLKKNFSFKAGSYRIYRDSSNWEIDSFVVVRNYIGSTEYNNNGRNSDVESDEMNFHGPGIQNGFGSWNLCENYIQFFFGLDDSVFCSYYLLLHFPFESVGYAEPLDFYRQLFSKFQH
jgi:hypothetical protein